MPERSAENFVRTKLDQFAALAGLEAGDKALGFMFAQTTAEIAEDLARRIDELAARMDGPP